MINDVLHVTGISINLPLDTHEKVLLSHIEAAQHAKALYSCKPLRCSKLFTDSNTTGFYKHASKGSTVYRFW